MSLAHDVAGAKSSLRWDRSDNFWWRAVCWLIDSDWPSIGWQIVFFVHDINNAESSLHWQNFFYLVLSFWSVDWFRSTQHRLEYCPSLCMISAICLLSSAFIIKTVIIISVLNSLCLPHSKNVSFHHHAPSHYSKAQVISWEWSIDTLYSLHCACSDMRRVEQCLAMCTLCTLQDELKCKLQSCVAQCCAQ